MAIFSASFSVSQSADCKVQTFTDTSNYVTNDSSYTTASFVTRVFKFYNSVDALVDTQIMTGSDLVVEHDLTSDQWVSAKLELYLIGNVTPVPDFSKTNSILSTCFLKLCFSELVAATDCGCNDNCNCENSVESDKIKLLEYIKAAEIFATYSNAVLAQKQLDAGTVICEANQNA